MEIPTPVCALVRNDSVVRAPAIPSTNSQFVELLCSDDNPNIVLCKLRKSPQFHRDCGDFYVDRKKTLINPGFFLPALWKNLWIVLKTHVENL